MVKNGRMWSKEVSDWMEKWNWYDVLLEINALDECVKRNNKIAIVIQNEMLLHFYVYKKI